MTLKLYGHPQSICTKRVRTVLEEKKLQYDFIVVDFLKGEHLSEPYGVEFHPFKKIPVLVDDELDVKVFGKIKSKVQMKDDEKLRSFREQGYSTLPCCQIPGFRG